jgi:predicted enzyme related to lactoylglutathione lyase
MTSPIVFFDIAGPDDQQLKQFYASVFGWDAMDQSQFKVDVATPLEGTIRRDPAEKRIYIGVKSVPDALAQVEANGGTVDAPRFEVPGVVILGLFKDPAGNSMGVVELENGKVKIP